MDISIVQAKAEEFHIVAELVQQLLIELEPAAEEQIRGMNLAEVAESLLSEGRVIAFLARTEGQLAGLLTLHECAAIYAGGIFGEISELYVVPEYRSGNIGHRLLDAAAERGRFLGWKRLEVGTPPAESSPGTIRFYQREGFLSVGSRLRLAL